MKESAVGRPDEKGAHTDWFGVGPALMQVPQARRPEFLLKPQLTVVGPVPEQA